jgi:hypothetical protein
VRNEAVLVDELQSALDQLQLRNSKVTGVGFTNNTLTGTKFDPCVLFELNFLIKFYFIYHILFLVN